MKRTMKTIAAGLLTLSLAAGSMWSGVAVNTEADNFTESKTIWVIGDSIASEHDIDENNEVQITGWGNVLQQFVSDDVTIVNKARSGRSSKSYTMELVYKKDVMKKFKAGDIMIVQFGHNDEKDAPRYTDPTGDSNTEGSYKYYLKKMFIEPVLEKGGKVILASSVVRHLFDGDVLAEQTHEKYVIAMEELAEECQKEGLAVEYIDTFRITKDIYEAMGDEETAKLHAVIGKGDAAELDDTHYGPYGAVYMANEIAQQLKELGIECCQDVESAWLMEIDEETLTENRQEIDKFSWR